MGNRILRIVVLASLMSPCLVMAEPTPQDALVQKLKDLLSNANAKAQHFFGPRKNNPDRSGVKNIGSQNGSSENFEKPNSANDSSTGEHSPGNGNFSGGGIGAGSSSGGNGGGSGGASLGFNEDNTKSTPQAGPANNGNGGNGGGGNSGDGGGSGGSVPDDAQLDKFDKFYPMCLVMDGNVVSPETANSTVKGLIDDAAHCGVHLVVYPRTVTGTLGMRATAINEQSQRICNGIQSLGVPRISTSTCAEGDDLADEMCGQREQKPDLVAAGRIWTKEVAGCAQLQGGEDPLDHFIKLFNGDREKATTALAQLESSGHSGGQSQSGQAAPSIEDSGSCDADTVGHEALGHSMLGHPNGASDGKGIGLTQDPAGAGINNRKYPGGGWSGEGCAAMVGAAFPVEQYKDQIGELAYDFDKPVYYTQPDKTLWLDINQQPPIFNKTPTFSDRAMASAKPPAVGGRPNGRIVGDAQRKVPVNYPHLTRAKGSSNPAVGASATAIGPTGSGVIPPLGFGNQTTPPSKSFSAAGAPASTTGESVFNLGFNEKASETGSNRNGSSSSGGSYDMNLDGPSGANQKARVESYTSGGGKSKSTSGDDTSVTTLRELSSSKDSATVVVSGETEDGQVFDGKGPQITEGKNSSETEKSRKTGFITDMYAGTGD